MILVAYWSEQMLEMWCLTRTSSRASMEDMEKHLWLSDLALAAGAKSFAARSTPLAARTHWDPLALGPVKILRSQVVCQKTCACNRSSLMAQSQLFLAFLEDGYPLADLKDERWKVQEAFLVIEASVIPWTAVPH